MKTGLRVIKNSISLMGGQGYGIMINLLATAIIARYLPLEVFGDYGFILAICMTFSVVTDMGTNQIMIREIARDKDRSLEIFSSGFMLNVLLSFLTVGLITVVIHLTTESQHIINATYILTIAILIYMLGDNFDIVFKAHEQMKYNAYSKIIEETMYIAAIITVVMLDLGLYGIFFAYLFAYTTRFIVGYLFTRSKFFKPQLKWNLPVMKWIFRESFPIGLSRIFRKTTFRIDTILLKLLRTRAEVGVFHGVYRFIIIAIFIPRDITDSVFPIMSRYAAGSRESITALFQKSFKIILILTIPMIFTVFMASDRIITLILGSNFAHAAPLMQLLTLAWGVMFFSVLCNKILNATNNQRLATIAIGICLIVNVIIDLITIPLYGYIGAGIATLTSEIVLFILSYIFISKYVCNMSLGKVVFKPFVAALAAAVAGLILGGSHVLFTILINFIVYISLLFFLGVFKDGELDIMKEIAYKIRRKIRKIEILGG